LFEEDRLFFYTFPAILIPKIDYIESMVENLHQQNEQVFLI